MGCGNHCGTRCGPKITRPKYEREGERDASYLTGAEWALIGPYMPVVNRFGRLSETGLRAALDGILYIARTGCQWCMLPKDFPLFITVRVYFFDWRDEGSLKNINFQLLRQAREPGSEPLGGVIETARYPASKITKETHPSTPIGAPVVVSTHLVRLTDQKVLPTNH